MDFFDNKAREYAGNNFPGRFIVTGNRKPADE